MRTKQLVLTALFAALTAIGAFLKIQIPVEGIPAITLQFFFTAMAGVLLGAKYGAISQAVYVLLGLVGLPIFTMGGGFSYVLQPSFGFLVGLIPSAWVIGMLCKNAKSFWPMALGILAGLAVLYLIGTPYMGLILNLYLGKGMSVWQIVRAGCLLYLPGDVLKIVVCTALCLALRSRLPAFQIRLRRKYHEQEAEHRRHLVQCYGAAAHEGRHRPSQRRALYDLRYQ